MFLLLQDTDLLPLNDTTSKLVKSAFGGKDGHEEEAIYGADHRVSEGGRGRRAGQAALPEARFQRRGVPRLALEVRGLQVNEVRRLRELRVIAGNWAGTTTRYSYVRVCDIGRPHRRPGFEAGPAAKRVLPPWRWFTEVDGTLSKTGTKLRVVQKK